MTTTTAPAPKPVKKTPLWAKFLLIIVILGVIAGAALVGTQGVAGHVVMIAGAPVDRQPAIAKALSEALAFLPPQPGGVDITFADSAPPPGALLFDLSPPPAPPEPAPRPKGPPILR